MKMVLDRVNSCMVIFVILVICFGLVCWGVYSAIKKVMDYSHESRIEKIDNIDDTENREEVAWSYETPEGCQIG